MIDGHSFIQFIGPKGALEPCDMARAEAKSSHNLSQTADAAEPTTGGKRSFARYLLHLLRPHIQHTLARGRTTSTGKAERMKKAVLLFLAVFAAAASPSQHCKAEERAMSRRGNSATDLHFLNDIMATKSNDQRLYVLLGGSFLRPLSFGDPKIFVSKWLTANPNAVVTNISRMITTNTITHKQQEIVYIWIENGGHSLNVDLVRAGIFAGGAMFDMVDNQKGLDQLLKTDPKLADARAQIEKEKAAAPQDRTDRLVSEGDYKARMHRIEGAESKARAKKLGIWSETMKDEREAEGIR